MENKKTIIGIIIVLILIIVLVVASYLYNNFNTKQLNLLTEESNKILQADLSNTEIDFDIKTEKNYATVEKAIKEYTSKLQNIYKEIDTVYTGINPNDIFSANNIEDKSFEEIDTIMNEYKEKSQNYFSEYKELTKEEKILENIEQKDLTLRKEYYTDLYKSVMLSDVMKKQYEELGQKIEKIKDEINSKMDKIEKIKEYLEENEKYWIIKNEKIQFTNLNRMTEYYNLLNQLTD